jgi:hypothetical protein
VINVQGTTAYPFRLDPSQFIPASTDITTLPPYVVNATDPNLKYPMVWKTNVAVDQKLPWGLVGTLEYIYNKQLQGLRYIDANLKGPDRNFLGPDTRGRFPASGLSGGAVNPARFYNTQVTNVFVLKNTKIGYSYTITAKLEKPTTKGFGGMLGYTYGQAKDMQSVSSTVEANTPSVGGQNYLGAAYANNDLRHRIVGFANYRINYGDKFGGSTMFSLGMVSYSGGNSSTGNPGKISYTYGSELNGDGQTTNDLLFVANKGTDLAFTPFTSTYKDASGNTVSKTFTEADQQAAYDVYIDGNKYLKTRRGQYAERNAAVYPWLTRFDFTLIQEFYIKVGANEKKNTLQLRLDILNVGNLLNNKWGLGYATTTANPVSVDKINPDGTPVYKMATQTVNGEPILIKDSFIKSVTLDNVWQAQVGIRYIFN